jgi:NTP pyrophosphatase (non-canonical NTP hydrolase)
MANKIMQIGKSTKEENEILNILSEESAEVIQAISKVFGFGWDSANPSTPTRSNRMHLQEEIGDMLCMVEILVDKGILDMHAINVAKNDKLIKLTKFSDIDLK